MYKGFFWYSPNENKLISYKTECDRFGRELNVLEKSFDFDNENEVLSVWTSFPKEIKKFKPYNYYPRGKVDFDRGKAIITINPTLNRCEIIELIIKEFNIGWAKRIITINNSNMYDYIMPYKATKCNLCGKIFDYWDYEENFELNFKINGLYSKYNCHHVNLNLCIDCISRFDNLIDYILNQCEINPIIETQ